MQEKSPKELRSLRKLISRNKQICHNCPKDDEFLMKFLRAKGLNVNSAFATLKKYIELRQKIKYYNPESVREILEGDIIISLQHRDPQGRRIGLVQPSYWDVDKVSSEQLILAGTLCLEQTIQSVETQENGIVCILNGKELSFSHCMKIGFKQIARIVGMFQGSFPVRLKQVHVVNEPKVFGILYSIGYPMLSEKLKKRIHLHGKDLDALYKFLPREILPYSLGGDLPDSLAMDKHFMADLLSRDEYFKSTSNLINTSISGV